MNPTVLIRDIPNSSNTYRVQEKGSGEGVKRKEEETHCVSRGTCHLETRAPRRPVVTPRKVGGVFALGLLFLPHCIFAQACGSRPLPSYPCLRHGFPCVAHHSACGHRDGSFAFPPDLLSQFLDTEPLVQVAAQFSALINSLPNGTSPFPAIQLDMANKIARPCATLGD